MREALNQRSREHVIRQLGAFESNRWAADLIAGGDLNVYGVFYLAESGTFTCYDRLSGNFHAIGEGQWGQ